MPLEAWMKLRLFVLLGCLVISPSPAGSARPRFDTSTDMGLVLVPADAEVDSVIFRLRATDQDADFPLIFDITATVTPIVRIENLPCTLYNKVCQANVILTKRLVPGRLHDFAVRVKDSKGDSNSMQATISVTNATTQRDKIFPHIPAIIMVPEDTKPGKELDYVLVRSNQWSGKPVYIELWQPKELFTIRQRQTPAETRGVITLIGELDFETQSMYTVTMYATDPYTEPKKDTRNIAGLQLVVIVQDVQDVPPIFTLAPPLTKINNTVQPGDIILRVHAEDGDKGVPREVTYGLVSEGNPFTPFFNISETTGEITLARSLEELTQITHVGAPVVLSVVAEEIRRSTSEPPAQATVVEVGLLLGEPGNSPPFFENDNYVTWIDENAEPGSMLVFTEHYSTKVHDEDIGKAGVFALKLYNNNGTFEISPAVAERTANFIITVRDNSLINYETFKSLRFEIIAQEVGPATNLSTSVPATIFVRDINDNAPEFDSSMYEVTLSEDVAAGTRVIQVHAKDKDTGSFGRIQYTRIIGPGNEAFAIDPNTGIITVAMGNSLLDREITPSLQLSIEARDEDGRGLRGIVPFIVNLLDVNDNPPIFERDNYEFTLNEDSTNFTVPAIIKASDADAEPPNNEIRYELVHGNYENKFYLDEITGEIFLREPINKVRRTRQHPYRNFATKVRKDVIQIQKTFEGMIPTSSSQPEVTMSLENSTTYDGDKIENGGVTTQQTRIIRKKRENDDVIFTLTARAYDLGVPHLSGVTRINVMKGAVAGARIVSFVVPGENPDPVKTAETLAAITGGRVTVQEIRSYTIEDAKNVSGMNVPSLEGEKKSIVVARVEPNISGTSLVDIERIKAALEANGVGVIGGGMPGMETGSETKSNGSGAPSHNSNTNTNTNINVTSVHSEEVTVYKAENRLLFWLLIILGLLMLLALIALIICCICPGCPFYMAPRKRRVHSSETLMTRSDGRPKRHLHRRHARLLEASWPGRKQAWSADPMRRNWQFNRRNQKASGLASLPGDVHGVDREQEILEKTGSLRLRDGPPMMYGPTEQMRRPEEEKIYMEDVEATRARGYVDIDLFRPQDPERGLENVHQAFVNQEEQRVQEQPKFIREQHYYRDGNAEILRLVTRGQIEAGAMVHATKRPQTLLLDQGQLGACRNDGKEILLQRFMEDQKHRQANGGQDLHDSCQDIERRSMESHHRQKDAINAQATQQQPKILLLPEKLEEDHRHHIEELGPEVQRLIIDHGGFEREGRPEAKGSQEFVQAATLVVHGPVAKVSTEKLKEQTSRQSVNHYSIHDLELARQNALLTRLLLEKDAGEVAVGAMADSASYLETQSLPGQVAIATQTDRTASTQTELPNRSRSDNDESEEEARIRKKLKSKKRYADTEPRRMRTLWMKSPIEEEEMQYGSEKRTIFLRKKIRDPKDSRRICLETEVLREISDSLDENGDPPITVRRKEDFRNQEDANSKQEPRNKEESERFEESSSMELVQRDDRKIDLEKRDQRDATDDESKKKSHRFKRENIIEPSFRILEKEMSSLSKKLSRLAGKKILQSSNGSETDSHETSKKTAPTNAPKIDKTEVVETKNLAKEVDTTKLKRSKSLARTVVHETQMAKERTKIREDPPDGKTRQTSKYRKAQNLSTGSSDFEDTVTKLRTSVPANTQAERQKQVLAKSSHSKLKRQSRLDHKDLGKPTPVALPPEAHEGKDTSDTASKESMKSFKSERDSTKSKEYSSGLEGQSGLASGSASSDSLKDKRPQRKERLLVDRKTVLEASGGKTDSERPGGSPGSEIAMDKGPRLKQRLDRKDPVDRSDGTSEHPRFPIPGPALERKNPSTAGETKSKSERVRESPGSKSTMDKSAESRERLTPSDREDVEAHEGKLAIGGDGSSEVLKDLTVQEKEIFTLNNTSAGDPTEGKTQSPLDDESINNFQGMVTQQTGTGSDRENAGEISEEKAESKAANEPSILNSPRMKTLAACEGKPETRQIGDSGSLEVFEDVTIQGKESFALNGTSAGDQTGEKAQSPLDDKTINNFQGTLTQETRPGLDRKNAVEISEEKTESKAADEPSDLDSLEIKTAQEKERPVLDRSKAVEVFESEDHSLDTFDENSNNLQDEQGHTSPAADENMTLHARETLRGVEKKEMTTGSPKKSDDESTVGTTVIEMEEKSSALPEIEQTDVSIAKKMPDGQSMEAKPGKGTAEITDATEPDDSAQESSEIIGNQVFEIPKEKLVDFLSHEVEDSTQAMQGHYHLMNEEAEKLKNIIFETVMKKVGEGTPGVPNKEQLSVPVKPQSSDPFEEWPSINENEKDSKIASGTSVTQKSEDGGAFSDNFDSFCGTDLNLQSSQLAKDSKDEIFYETLRSESSEEQTSAAEITSEQAGVKSGTKSPDTPERTEKSLSPQPATTPETLEQATITTTIIPTQSIGDSSELAPETAVSRSPTLVPSGSIGTGSETGLKPPVAQSDSIIQLTDRTEEPIDVPEKTTEPLASPKVEQFNTQSVESRGDKTPNEPLPDIQHSDENISPVVDLSDQESSKQPMNLLSPSREERILESPQKEFGIPDSLFLDAKIITAPSSPTNVEVPQEKAFKKGGDTADIPPLNLVELSRTMLDAADDSDSSETSTKTMMTARPYGTPRHRPVSGLEDTKPNEIASRIETTVPVAEALGSSINPKKTDREALPDNCGGEEKTEPDLHVEAEASRPEQIAGGTRAVEEKGSAKVPPAEISSESSNEGAVSVIKISQDMEKPDTAVRQGDAEEETSEKVQLSQIREKTLSTVPDGFASLPETGKPVKSSDDASVEAPLPEVAEKLPVEKTKVDVEDNVLEASKHDADGSITISKTDNSEERLKDTTVETLSPEVLGEIPEKMEAETHGVTVKGPPVGAKPAPRSKKPTKGAMKNGVSSDSKREQKVKPLKVEPAKPLKSMIAIKQQARLRDPKRQDSSTAPQGEQPTNLPSRPDRTTQVRKKLERPREDGGQKGTVKVETAKPSKSHEKSAAKQATDISATREKLKVPRRGKSREKEGKTKIIPTWKATKALQVEKTNQAETAADTATKKQARKDTEELVSSGKREMDIPTTLCEPKSSTPAPGPERLLENKDTEPTPPEASVLTSDTTDISRDTNMEIPSSEVQMVEKEMTEQVDIDTREQNPAMTDQIHETSIVSDSQESSAEPFAFEVLSKTMGNSESKEAGEIKLDDIDAQLDPKGSSNPEASESNAKDSTVDKTSKPTVPIEKIPSPKKAGKPRKEPEPLIIEGQSRYMEWYKLKREEMERKRQERKDGDEEEVRPKWLRKRTRQRWIKVNPEDRKLFDPRMTESEPFPKRKIKPLVNAESEQLKAIVRQGRKMRRAQGEDGDDPRIEIFAPETPPTPLSSVPTTSRCHHHHHHLVQHSEYKYEKMPLPPFYLHSPIVHATATQIPPQKFDDLCPQQDYSSLPTESRCPNEKLRHGELLEKKSVFDIAYSEAAPGQLRSDSTTPPS